MLKRSKLSSLLLILLLVPCLFLSGCKTKPTLLFLNWGEYISDEFIEKFEKEYNCNLIVDIADSNELFYSKIKGGTTAYDLCCPADYMVEKMYVKGLLEEIDFNKVIPDGIETDDAFEYTKSQFMPGVLEIEKGMNDEMVHIAKEFNVDYDHSRDEINRYHFPYFWGTFGLQYNKLNPDFKDENTYDKITGEFIKNEPDGQPDIFQEGNRPWSVYYESDRLSPNTRVGMYSAVRFAYGAALFYGRELQTEEKTLSPNTPVADGRKLFNDYLTQRRYVEWSTDHLKHSIESHNIDLAFTYTGDCMDMGYLKIKDGVDYEDLEFNVFVPQNTIMHTDTLVIPKGGRNLELAHKFLQFCLNPDNAYLNSSVVGYCPPLQAVYDKIVRYSTLFEDLYAKKAEDSSFNVDEAISKLDKDTINKELVSHGLPKDLTLEQMHWYRNWGMALKTTFPIEKPEDIDPNRLRCPLSFFSKDDLTIITNIMNNAKARQ